MTPCEVLTVKLDILLKSHFAHAYLLNKDTQRANLTQIISIIQIACQPEVHCYAPTMSAWLVESFWGVC